MFRVAASVDLDDENLKFVVLIPACVANSSNDDSSNGSLHEKEKQIAVKSKMHKTSHGQVWWTV